MKGIKFVVGDELRMGDVRRAESSNSAAAEIMAQYACHEDTGAAMPESAFLSLVDEMTVSEFMQLWVVFIGSAVPNGRGRR